MKKSLPFFVLIVLSIVLIASCSQPDNKPTQKEVLSPSFIGDITVPTGRFLVDMETADDELISKVFYYWYAPAISSFETRSLNENDTYTATFLDSPLSITYKEESDGKQSFSGTSSNDDMLFSVVYDSETDTYDFKQVLLMEQASQGNVRNQMMISVGTGISLDADGNSHGTMKYYTFQKEEGFFAFGDGEFFTNNGISAFMSHSNQTINSTDDAGLKAEIARLDYSLDGTDGVIDFMEATAPTSEEPEYYSLFWFDKATAKFDRTPKVPDSPEVPSFTDKVEAQTKASEISNGEWILL